MVLPAAFLLFLLLGMAIMVEEALKVGGGDCSKSSALSPRDALMLKLQLPL